MAPIWSSTGGILLNNFYNFNANFSYRFIGDRPANDDNSLTAVGYFLIDCNINYTYKQFNFGVIIENLLDTDWKETQFATVSRLRNEDVPIEDIDFIPGTPLNIKGRISFSF